MLQSDRSTKTGKLNTSGSWLLSDKISRDQSGRLSHSANSYYYQCGFLSLISTNVTTWKRRIYARHLNIRHSISTGLRVQLWTQILINQVLCFKNFSTVLQKFVHCCEMFEVRYVVRPSILSCSKLLLAAAGFRLQQASAAGFRSRLPQQASAAGFRSRLLAAAGFRSWLLRRWFEIKRRF